MKTKTYKNMNLRKHVLQNHVLQNRDLQNHVLQNHVLRYHVFRYHVLQILHVASGFLTTYTTPELDLVRRLH